MGKFADGKISLTTKLAESAAISPMGGTATLSPMGETAAISPMVDTTTSSTIELRITGMSTTILAVTIQFHSVLVTIQ